VFKHLGFAFARVSIGIIALLIFSAGSSFGQTAPIPPVIGSPNTVTADPAVPRPRTAPCVVTLFSNFEFDNFNAQTFSYAPPANCPGPWAKIVFEANFNVTAGVQFDRTAAIYLGHANIYYGTTAEPAENFGPSWHIERDLTDYSSLFTAAQTGEVDLGNLVNSQDTSIIFGSATVSLYPLAERQHAPDTADAVFPMPDAAGGAATLSTSADQLTGTFTLPTNVERAYLDVLTQSQSNDEFWYTCVPNDVSGELESCGNTAFREAEISVDGTPAGVAPVYPWIYTGGVDPFLWSPLPGVQTLNFVPYRVDLTPFAGLLSNGQPHTVAVSVFNADSYFLATASLLVYLDHGSTQVTGAVTQNTIGAEPNPKVVENLTTNSDGSIDGSVSVTSLRAFEVAGFVNTSHGKIFTQVLQDVNFSSVQQFVSTDIQFTQDINQSTRVNSTTLTRVGPQIFASVEQFKYPLVFDINITVNADGSEDQQSTVHQEFDRDVISPGFISAISNHVDSTDTLVFGADGSFSNQGQASDQHFTEFDSTGVHYECSLAAANGVLTSIGHGCLAH
jgi:Peptide N-acetyl-beta-D-glucosaminyl asparaginase amidase A